MRFPVVAIVVALLAAGCSSSAAVAATVDGVDIEMATVENMVVSEEELADSDLREILTAVIQWTIVADAARDDFEIDPTGEEVSDYEDEIVADTGLAREEYLDSQQITEQGFTMYARQLLTGDQVIALFSAQVETPTEAEAQQALSEDPVAWTTSVCAVHILVDTEEEATAVLARLEAGEDFATVATEVSLDSGSAENGGDLGCASPSNYVAEFADATATAEIGSVTEPVETTYGFHLIRVDSRTVATTEEIVTALEDERLSDLVNDWYLTAVSAADVTVDPELGTWETDPYPTVAAPAAEEE